MSLIERLQQLPDCRKARGQRHPHWLILLLVILAGLTGYWGNRPVAEFAQRYAQAIFDKLGLPPEIKPPSYSTVRRLMQQLDYEILAQLFTDWAMAETEFEAGQWLATDGKGIGSTLTDHVSAEQNFVSLVSLFSHTSGIVQGVMPMENKLISEQEVVRRLLDAVGLSGVGITMDALHCQKKR